MYSVTVRVGSTPVTVSADSLGQLADALEAIGTNDAVVDRLRAVQPKPVKATRKG